MWCNFCHAVKVGRVWFIKQLTGLSCFKISWKLPWYISTCSTNFMSWHLCQCSVKLVQPFNSCYERMHPLFSPCCWKACVTSLFLDDLIQFWIIIHIVILFIYALIYFRQISRQSLYCVLFWFSFLHLTSEISSYISEERVCVSVCVCVKESGRVCDCWCSDARGLWGRSERVPGSQSDTLIWSDESVIYNVSLGKSTGQQGKGSAACHCMQSGESGTRIKRERVSERKKCWKGTKTWNKETYSE